MAFWDNPMGLFVEWYCVDLCLQDKPWERDTHTRGITVRWAINDPGTF